MADDDLEVLVEDPPAPAPDPNEIGDPAKPAAAAKPVTKPEDGVDILKQQLKASQDEASANAARAEAAAREAVAAKTEVQQTNVQLVENAIAAVKSSLDQAEANYADAMAAQDFAGAAKIQRQMAEDAARKLTLENGLESLKNAPKPQAAVPPDPVEAFAQTLTPPAAAWIRSHPDYVRNPKLNQRLVSAHNDALTYDIVPDTPAYFAHVEARLGLRSAPEGDSTEVALSDGAQAAGGRSTSTAPPAAPARSGGNGSGRTVRLTAAQVEAAALSGMTPQEYARELERLKGEDRIGKHLQ